MFSRFTKTKMFEYDQWFYIADADGDGRVGGAEAVHFFMRAGLPKSDLAKLWDAADSARVGFLDRRTFSLACVLIGALQQYGTITRDVFEKATSGRTEGLPKPKLQGLELTERPREAPDTFASTATRAESQPSRAHEPAPAYDPSMQFTSPPQDDFFAMGSGQDGFSATPSTAAPQAPASFEFRPPQSAASNAPLAQTFEAPALQSHAPGPVVQWPVIGPSDWQRYQQIFLSHTKGDPAAKLTGQQVAPILLGMNAPKQVLKDIWEVSDGDKDGGLTWSEFVVAVYLTEQARKGIMPPKVLPPGKFPPFSLTAGAQSVPPVQQQTPVFASVQPNTITTNGLITPSMVRDELQTLTGPMSAPPPNEEYSYRGPVTNISSMPQQDQDLAQKVSNDAQKNDRELWDQEMKERAAKMSAQAAQEALANLAMFVRKCEAALSEASYRAEAAEMQVKELRQKYDSMQNRVRELAEKIEEPIKRIEASKKEYDDLAEQFGKLEAKHADLAKSAASAAPNEAKAAQELASIRARVEEKSAQIAADKARASQFERLTTSQQVAAQNFFDLSDTPAPVLSPASANGMFDEWGKWGKTANEEVSLTKTIQVPVPPTHTKSPSDVPAVAAALTDVGGNFFASIDTEPARETSAVDSAPASFDAYDDPFGAPPPTPPEGPDLDDPFGAAPSPGPTPPAVRKSLEIDPFASG